MIKQIAGGICPAVEIACGIGKLFFVLKLASKKEERSVL